MATDDAPDPQPLPTKDAIRGRLERERGEVQFSDMKAHLARDAVFVVASSLDLVDVGVAVAFDDVATVGRWIETGDLRKPTRAEREAWPMRENARWTAVVVQPFVLVHILESSLAPSE